MSPIVLPAIRLVKPASSRQPLSGDKPTFPSSGEPTQWITYSLRPKLLSRTKDKFRDLDSTWTIPNACGAARHDCDKSVPTPRLKTEMTFDEFTAHALDDGAGAMLGVKDAIDAVAGN
jgi:hypothetical protein